MLEGILGCAREIKGGRQAGRQLMFEVRSRADQQNRVRLGTWKPDIGSEWRAPAIDRKPVFGSSEANIRAVSVVLSFSLTPRWSARSVAKARAEATVESGLCGERYKKGYSTVFQGIASRDVNVWRVARNRSRVLQLPACSFEVESSGLER